ncbi:hypothetical protein COO60DRAFT_1053592 [Scenedesmus sp. NREL 46B-D3]|nr:hypothetical protein COO60DRAFT_1053592 [Scenedesmus sp. NREL 46B-D3]
MAPYTSTWHASWILVTRADQTCSKWRSGCVCAHHATSSTSTPAGIASSSLTKTQCWQFKQAARFDLPQVCEELLTQVYTVRYVWILRPCCRNACLHGSPLAAPGELGRGSPGPALLEVRIFVAFTWSPGAVKNSSYYSQAS